MDQKNELNSNEQITEEVKLNYFYQVVEKAQQTEEVEPLLKVIKEVFEIEHVAPSAEVYIRSTLNTEKIAGPLDFSGFAKSYKSAMSYKKLFDLGPEDKIFPALHIASETYGHYYYLRLETGEVAGGHHDSLYNEYFYDIWNPDDPIETVNSLFSEYSVPDYPEFLALQEAFATNFGVKDTRQFSDLVSPDDYLAILANVLGVSRLEWVVEALDCFTLLYEEEDINEAMNKIETS